MKFKLILFLSLIVNIACSQENPPKAIQNQPVKEDFKDDWANLSKYQKDNLALGAPRAGERRVVLLRFRADVIDLKAKAVIILAGSNDIAANTGHITNERIMDNIKSMVELAKANKIKVILCAYLPIIDYPWRKGLEPADKIIALNRLITAYATQENLVLLDYFTPFVNEVKGQKAELTVDGVHPNLKGYKIMEVITDQAIAKALK
ncbi:MAG: acylhydrolase [Pedobacter sp.]|nr:MAG: acylhydrolase [Pedobacter sp.]